MKTLRIITLSFLLTTTLHGQQDVVIDKVVSNIAGQLMAFPHEKIHLHTDKPYYITGEKLFFRAYLLDALTHLPVVSSRYVYVELINPADSVVQRVKIRPDKDGLFHGAVSLPEDLPQGSYQLRAYTQYMQNQNGGNWENFSKLVRILDPQILSVQLETDFQFDEKGKVSANLRFMDVKTKEILHPQKAEYIKRARVDAGIVLTDKASLPLAGNFSISITNDNEVVIDTTSGILSNMSLFSELKGHINYPEYYFQNNNKEAASAADLLMKTQGWRRYNIPEILQGKLSHPEIPFETGLQIAGTVKSGIMKKPVKGYKVTLLSTKVGFMDVTETDKNGRFMFHGIELPDSAAFFVMAKNGKGEIVWETVLNVDNEIFPETHSSWIEPAVREEKISPVLEEYVAKADLHYSYENGMRIVHLPEVQIKGFQKKELKYISPFYSEPDYSISEEDIKKHTVMKTSDFLYMVPGILMINGVIYIRGDRDPLIVIDDIPRGRLKNRVELDNLIHPSDIGQMDIIKGTPMYGKEGGNVIAIYTKKGGAVTPPPTYNTQVITPLGYQPPVEFYSPKYETQESLNDSKPDLRTTIYWKPNVITDEQGRAKIDFYTADNPATYSVVIEGIGDDGRLIQYRGKGVMEVRNYELEIRN